MEYSWILATYFEVDLENSLCLLLSRAVIGNAAPVADLADNGLVSLLLLVFSQM